MITIHGRTAPARPRPAGLAVPLAAAALAALLAAAGCSSPASTTSSPATTAAGSGGAQSTGSARLAQFAQCMRSHGVPDFPDPTAQGTFNLLPAMTGSAQFQSADQACRSLAPPGSLSGQGPTTQQLNEAVKFVGCMRKHGVPDFPDPGPSGKFQLQGGPNPVNPHAPQFKSALQACRTLMPPGNGFGAGS